MSIIIAGINTGAGKTVISALFMQNKEFLYWKPVQAGFPRDADFIERFLTVIGEEEPGSRILPEAFLLEHPVSPHEAAAREGKKLTVAAIKKKQPKVDAPLIIELAGGIMTPINDKQTMLDLAKSLGHPVIMVVDYYLGCINHTLLTLTVCKQKGLDVMGLVFNGEINPYTKDVILKHFPLPVLLEVPEMEEDWLDDGSAMDGLEQYLNNLN